MEIFGGIVLIGMILFIMTKHWFWTWLFFLSAIASLFTMIASIFHFQILAAVGLFVLSLILFRLTAFVSEL